MSSTKSSRPKSSSKKLSQTQKDELRGSIHELLSSLVEETDPAELLSASTEVSKLIENAIESGSKSMMEDVYAQSSLILEQKRIHQDARRRKSFRSAIQVAIKVALAGMTL